MNGSTSRIPIPPAEGLSQEMAGHLQAFVGPWLGELDARLDRRLVHTFAEALGAIVRQRHTEVSLVLTELGELLTDGAHAPAGVKRLWRLLRCPKWQAEQVDTWLGEQAEAAVAQAEARDGVAFAVLDDSEVEKPAARALEGLTKVRSARARRLQRAGGAPPPKVPTLVPGFGWVAVVVTGRSGAYTRARMHWFSPRLAEGAERPREAEQTTLLPFLLLWGERVIWLVDRGFGTAAFLGQTFARARFVARWRPDYPLRDPTSGEVARASALSRRVRSRWTTQVGDPWTKQTWTVGLASLPVTLPEDDRPLWLVVARRKGKSQTLWLLTTEDAATAQGALRALHGYARRWQVEWAFRFAKSGLGIQSVRVQSWTYREKLWRLAALVHAFLLSLLVTLDDAARERLLRWCHRTGTRAREAIAPLYRLRHALGTLWEKHRPILTGGDPPHPMLA
jgi:hypothetical protein